MTFRVIRHEPGCGAVLMDGYPFRGGPLRLRCAGCRQRVWVASDGETVSIVLVDNAPKLLASSQ